MRRRALAVALAWGAGFAVPVPAAADLREIQASGRLRVAVVPTEGPDEFFTTGPEAREQPGFDREVLEAFCRSLGLALEVVHAPGWETLAPLVAEGKADVAAGRVTVTEGRSALVSFSETVFPTRHVVVTRRPQARVTTLEGLRRLKVGTVRGTSMSEAVARAGVPAVLVDDAIVSGRLPQALRQVRVQAVVLGIENYITERRRDPELESGLFLGAPGRLAYAVRHGDRSLLQALNRHLAALRASEHWGRLLIKYFGADAPQLLARASAE